MEELRARVPLDLGLRPLAMLILDDVLVLDLPAGLATVEEPEGRAERRGRPGELEDVAPGDRIPFFLISHGFMLSPAEGVCQAARRPIPYSRSG